VLDVDGTTAPGDELVLEGKTVGRITSAADGLALGYVRTEVPDDAALATPDGHASIRR
jgi:hypothetical protein